MAQVNLSIGGNSYQVACRDGEEAHLQSIAAMVDAKVAEARGAVGNSSEVRQLLLASLLLADEVAEGRSGNPRPATPDPAPLEALASKLESIATRLEKQG